MDLRDAKRKQDDLLNIEQKSFNQDLEIFAIKPKIVEMSESVGDFEPSMRHIPHQKSIMYITLAPEDTYQVLIKFYRDTEPHEQYDKIQLECNFYHETEAQDRRSVSDQTKCPFTVLGLSYFEEQNLIKINYGKGPLQENYTLSDTWVDEKLMAIHVMNDNLIAAFCKN